MLDTRHVKSLGRKGIEIYMSSEAELAATKRIHEQPLRQCLVVPLQSVVVRLRGLPFNATAAAVADFLQGVRVARGDNAIILDVTKNGRPNGTLSSG